MKIAMIIVRTLLGLLFVFASVTFFLMYYFKLFPMPEMQGTVKTFNEGLGSVGYFFPMLKILELLCGIALLVGRYVPLALVVLAPIVVNIFMFHALIDPTGIPVAIFVLLAELFLAYYYRAAFRPLFQPKYTA